ncbi:MAG: hypothetical protein JNL61_09640 [Rhizobiaceae bacterium]|nr:hypothetical protein [Rhizobiaceae bacterium]
MTGFTPVSTIISMVLGLGVTRMLLGLIAVFRSRHRAHIDWLPLAWAAIIFLTQMQYWWAVTHIPPEFQGWSFESFVALTGFTGLLFVCGALLLPPAEMPERENLRTFFETEGKWALLFLALFFALSLVVNVFYFRVGLFEPWALLNLIATVLPLVVFFSSSRAVRAAITLAALAYYAVILVASSDERFTPFLAYPFEK